MFDNFDQFLEENFIDPNGVVYSLLDRQTRRPVDELFFQPYGRKPDHENRCGFQPPLPGEVTHWGKDTFTLPEFVTYENCGMCTGAYLDGLCSALRTPGADTEEVRCRAKRTFDAIRYIAGIGNQWEYGFFPKIWGNKFRYQTSTDQYLYVLHGMNSYYPFASEKDRREIERLIPAMVDFWMKRQYRLTYYNLIDMDWPPLRFPGFLMLAYKYTGDEKYRKEAIRILDAMDGKIVEHAVRCPALICSADAICMDTSGIEMMAVISPLPEDYCRILLDGLKEEFYIRIKSLTEDGYFWTKMDYDLESGVAVPRKTDAPRSAWSCMIVRAGLQMSRFMPGIYHDARRLAENVLTKLRPEEMYYYHPDDAYHLPRYQQYKNQFLSGDAITNRQWTYRLYNELAQQPESPARRQTDTPDHASGNTASGNLKQAGLSV